MITFRKTPEYDNDSTIVEIQVHNEMSLSDLHEEWERFLIAISFTPETVREFYVFDE